MKKLSRRDALKGAASALAAAALSDVALAQTPQKTQAPIEPQAPDDPTKVPGKLPSEIGDRSPFEKPRRKVNRAALSGSSVTPLQDFHGIITPSDLHFERHHGGVPTIDPKRYSFLVHGLVDKPLKFTLD